MEKLSVADTLQCIGARLVEEVPRQRVFRGGQADLYVPLPPPLVRYRVCPATDKAVNAPALTIAP